MENRPSVGLQNAPVTKFLLGSIVINSTIVSVLDIQECFTLSLVPQLWLNKELWRLVTWQLFYKSAGEVLFGSLALYKLAVAERFMGSRHYAAFILIAFGTTSILVPFILGLLARPFSSKLNIIAAGLTPTIFAILFQYHALVPSSQLFQDSSRSTDATITRAQSHQAGRPSMTLQDVLTDKIWMYAIAGQLATCRLPTSLIGAATGWFVGACYYTGRLGKQWRLPSLLARLINIRPKGTIVRERRDSFSEPLAQQRTVDQTSTRPTSSNTTSPPGESDIQSLVSMMNVSREVAIEALAASGGSVEAAIDNLLSG